MKNVRTVKAARNMRYGNNTYPIMVEVEMYATPTEGIMSVRQYGDTKYAVCECRRGEVKPLS